MYRWVIVLCVMAAAVVAEVVEIQKCDNPNGLPEHCIIGEARVTPCAGGKVCRVRKGGDIALSFDFTPDYSAQKLNSTVFWASSMGDLPWTDMNPDGCASTTCPTEAGKTQQYNYSLHLGKKLPEGRFVLKWNVFDEADETKLCCFKFTIQIKK